jgi:hypothetical protein
MTTRLLDDMTAETETGHPGLNSWMDMMMMMIIITITVPLNTLAPKWLLPGLNFIPWTTDPHTTLVKKNSEPLLYEPFDTSVALTNPTHLLCSSCHVRNRLFHSLKTHTPYKQYSPVTQLVALTVLKYILMGPTGDTCRSHHVKMIGTDR